MHPKKQAPPHPHHLSSHIKLRPSHKRTQSHKGSVKPPGYPPPKDEEDEFMAASFLQFCATCEKQIITPCNDILYCSESCRRRDRKASYYSDEFSSPTSPFASFSFQDDLPAARDIVPPRSPTAPSKRFSIATSDSSEWEQTYTAARPRLAREDSEAANYLRQFQWQHSRNYSIDSMALSGTPRAHDYRSSTSTTAANTPSLSHTPTSTASLSMPYTPALSYQRPLPPRHKPHNSSSYGARSIDLVTPCTTFPTTAPGSLSNYSLKTAPSAATSHGVASGEVLYEKQVTLPSTPRGPGSLGKLFKQQS